MDDNRIEIVAGLDLPKTKSTIKGELEGEVKQYLDSTQALKITCHINTKDISNLQKQLSEISKGLKIDISGVNGNFIDKNAIKNQAKALTDALDLNIPRGKTQEVRAEIQKLINDYNTAFRSNDFSAMTKSFDALETYVNQFRKDVVDINEELAETQSRIRELARDSKVFVSESDYSELAYLLDGGKNANSILSKAFGVGGWTKNPLTAKTTWDQKVQELNDVFNTSRVNQINDIDSGRFNDHIDGVIQLVNYLNESFDQGDELVKEYGEEIQKAFGDQLYTELNKVLGVSVDVGQEFEEIFNPDEINTVTNEVVELGNAIQQSLNKYPDIPISSTTQDTLTGAKNILNAEFAKNADTLSDKATRVKRAIEDTEGELQRFYVQVERGDKSVETLTYAINEQGTAYEYLGKIIREADNSTDFRRKGIDTQWDIQTEKLKQFITNAEKAGATSTLLADDITNLKNRLAEKGDTSAMNAFLDDFDIAKAKLQAFNAEARKENAIVNLQNRIRRLSAELTAYASTNQRAVNSLKQMTSGKSFADEWLRISTQMANGAELSDREIKNLTADIAVFKKEAKSAGLEGANAFEKFGSAFKLISTYISANQVINMITRSIRSAVTELKEIDNTLTEISKTSDRTEESLRKLGQTSFDSASKYGRTANDFLLGVQEMSRAGFGEKQSENLAELSILAQAAGDMTAEMSNQYLIATNAAYGLEGNVERLNQVLDSQNYITNRNAVNMENLSQATKIAASQAAASGVAIDELTAAVGTMVATTQQGGDQAGRAFKGILMNIQQVKAAADDIGDGGADITAASLSKYEKASAALGVSLKEVRNGVMQLREPMEVLRDLSEAVRQESEGSIKVANLISAVGGKFRGNQLIALLENWDTYEKMLSEFNSNEAIGSAMIEADKSANNWAGSLNKVKNSWDSLVNEFINSDNAISMLQSINTILQNLSDSAASGTLRTLGSAAASLLEIISKLTNKIGTLPTLLAGLGVINSLRGKGIFGGEAFKQANGSLLTYIKSLDVAKIKTVALQTVTRAFAEVALMIAISKATEALNNFIHAEEQGIEAARELRETTLENIRSYNSEASESKELLSSYVELASTTSNLADEKKKLLDIQDKVNESISEQTEKTDLLNKSLSENIKLMQNQRRKEAERVVEEIQGQYDSIKQAQSASYEAMFTLGDKEVGKAVSEIEAATGMRISGTLSEQSAQLEKMLALYRDIDGYNHSYYNTLVSGKQVIDDQLADWETIVKTYDEARKTISELSISEETQRSFDDLINKAGELYRELNGEGSAEHKLIAFEELSNIKTELYDIAGNNSELRNLIETTFEAFDNGASSAIKSIGDLRSAWLETLDEMQKGSLKNISTMVSALQDLSENKGIAANTFWSLVEFDTEGLLNGAKLVGDKFYITQENMIKLKDQYVSKQIESIASTNAEIAQQKTLYDEQVKSYELQIAAMELRKTNITNPDEYNNLVRNLEIAKQNAKAYGDEWERNNWLIQYLNQSLGNTIDRTKQLQAQQKQLNEEVTKLNKELDARLKAQEYVIDNIISGHEEELAAINEEKQALQDELDSLNEQKNTLDEIIKNYETVNSIVQNTVQKEIDALEEQKKAIEDTYKKRIDALKSENEQREDALEYAQKLANLENARNNKRYVYDETRGWRYESVKEDVQNAENDLRSFETSQAIKELERQRDEETATIDEVIKSREEYAKLWKEISEEIKTEEDEMLAEEILGADWRQKIADGDIDVMNKFRTEYRNHNAALKTLTNTEIKLKEEAIKAKDAEVKAKQEQIDSWKKYKTEVQKAVSEAKSKQEEYMKYLDDVKLNESSTLADRAANFETFKNSVNGMMDAIGEKQNIIEQVTASLDQISGGDYQINFDVWGLDSLREARDILDDMAIKSMEVITSQEMVNRVLGGEMSLSDAVKAMREGKIRGYSSGGVVDSTGVAMLHGRKNAPELILNARDTAKIYSLIHNTPNLMAAVMDEARNVAGFKLNNNNTNNSSVAIGAINVYANNPTDLARNLDKQLDQYFRTKLTQSYTGKQ